jgi:flagellin-like protein
MSSIKNLLEDDSGVSPVIGVILMVAITVILAAVIASFVLGLGDSQEAAPNIAFDTDFDPSDGNVTLTINSVNDDANAEDIIIRGGAVDGDITWPSNVSAGGAIEMNVTSSGFSDSNAPSGGVWADDVANEEIRIVYETDDSSESLRTIDVPEE